MRADGRLASMEPHPSERGNRAAAAIGRRGGKRFNGATSFRTWKHFEAIGQIVNNGMASMEPHPSERGNSHSPCNSADQWPSLQWSHILPNVETSPPRTNRRRVKRCFNGATSFRTWKQ